MITILYRLHIIFIATSKLIPNIMLIRGCEQFLTGLINQADQRPKGQPVYHITDDTPWEVLIEETAAV